VKVDRHSSPESVTECRLVAASAPYLAGKEEDDGYDDGVDHDSPDPLDGLVATRSLGLRGQLRLAIGALTGSFLRSHQARTINEASPMPPGCSRAADDANPLEVEGFERNAHFSA
jgi:hypothetical protein